MQSFLGAPPVTVTFAIPSAGTAVDPATGNQYPATDEELVDCIIATQSGAARRDTVEAMPGFDKTSIPVTVWPVNGAQWSDEIRKQSPAKGNLIWQGKPAVLTLKISEPIDGRVAGSGLLGVLGDRAVGMITIQRTSSRVEV